jgi:hypothetical protein
MSHRAFDAAAREATGEPITFTVGQDPYTFTVQTPLPMGQLIIFARSVEDSADAQTRALDKLMRGWLIESDREHWDKCLAQLTSLDVLGQIINYIVEEATGRPTQASST